MSAFSQTNTVPGDVNDIYSEMMVLFVIRYLVKVGEEECRLFSCWHNISTPSVHKFRDITRSRAVKKSAESLVPSTFVVLKRHLKTAKHKSGLNLVFLTMTNKYVVCRPVITLQQFLLKYTEISLSSCICKSCDRCGSKTNVYVAVYLDVALPKTVVASVFAFDIACEAANVRIVNCFLC